MKPDTFQRHLYYRVHSHLSLFLSAVSSESRIDCSTISEVTCISNPLSESQGLGLGKKMYLEQAEITLITHVGPAQGLIDQSSKMIIPSSLSYTSAISAIWFKILDPPQRAFYGQLQEQRPM